MATALERGKALIGKWKHLWRTRRMDAIGAILIGISLLALLASYGLRLHIRAAHVARCAAYTQCLEDAEDYRQHEAMLGIHYEIPADKCIETMQVGDNCPALPQPGF